MKKIHILMFVLYLCGTNAVLSQNHYYYYQGHKKYVTLDKSGLEITTTPVFQSNSISANNIEPILLEASGATEKNGSIEFLNSPTDTEYLAKISEIKSNQETIIIKLQVYLPNLN